MHLGTAIALLLYFWRDWFDFGMAVVVRRGPEARAERNLFLRVVVATLPAVVVGAALEHNLATMAGHLPGHRRVLSYTVSTCLTRPFASRYPGR